MAEQETPERLEREIAGARLDMAQAIDELKGTVREKLDVKGRVRARARIVKGQARQRAHDLMDEARARLPEWRRRAREHAPLLAGAGAAAALLVGLGILVGRRRRVNVLTIYKPPAAAADVVATDVPRWKTRLAMRLQR